mmetsp:Transcript_6660/g.16984  ORF Transcript_6660/g.16984 Transcript_6660/m.16984 type:complete len:88 (+) Transcript_6660:2628-2891(+)
MTSRSELLRRTMLGYLDRSLMLVAVDDSDMTSASEPWPDDPYRASYDATDFVHVVPPGPTTATGLTGVRSLVHATNALGELELPQLP